MIDIRRGPAGHYLSQRRRLVAHPALWLALLGLLVAVGFGSDRLIQRGTSDEAQASFLDRELGQQRGSAALVRRPARGVIVDLRHGGYLVSLRGRTHIGVAAVGASGAWSRYSGGVARRTSFGREAITVRPTRTESLLQVVRRHGVRTWRWRLQSPGLNPTLTPGGTVTFVHNGVQAAPWIEPVRILDARGQAITPRGARWSLAQAHGRTSLLLRLDDRRLPLPYTIDPATDYPTLYFSSTASTADTSWRLATSAPSGANSSTSTAPVSGATGYYQFKPGTGNTTAATQGTSPKGFGWTQDLAGGTGFPAGSWSFTVQTQIPSATLVAGSAILSIGVWKGTINGSGKFTPTQTILAPTDDPAAQNIRSALGLKTTTVAYSLPAFSLAANERLWVEVWRKQVTGITSANAVDRQVNFVVNNGVGQIAHPAPDDTFPVNAFNVANVTGGVYFTSPGGTSGTIYYRGTAAGSFQLRDTATDTGSGVQQVTYPLVSKAGWTHAAETVTTGPDYPSNYSWTAGATSAPGAQAIVAQDRAANATTGTLTITNDTTAPTTPSVALTSPPAWYTTAAVTLTPTDGTDAGAGVDTTTRVYQRDETGMTGGVCNAFPNTWTATAPNPDTTVADGKCYRYRLLESDRVGNQSLASVASGTAKVDLAGPTAPALTFSALTNARAAGSTVYYRPSVSGSFTATASSTDSGSGVSGYTFGTAPTWTVTGSGANRTYAWTSSSTNPGPIGVFASDVAGNSGTATSFTPTPDSTLPTTTDDTATIGSGWKTSAQTVTLTPTDSGSGVANTYYTTDGSTPTTSSASGTSISLTADGVFTIKYFSVDNVGNQEPVQTASTQIRIDRTGPSTTMATLPASIRNGQVLTGSATDPLSGTQSVAYYYCSPSPCTPATLIGSSAFGPDYAVTWSSMPADGLYVVRAVGTDLAGNTGASAAQTVSLDNFPPTTSITAHPSDPSGNPSPSFSFTSSKPNSTFECKLDGGAYAGCVSPKAYSGLADSSHTFTVRATDGVGNVDPSPPSFTWTIDTVAPDTTITSQPPNPSGSSAASFSFTSSEQASTFQCKLDGGAFSACTSPASYSGLADGSHTFSVRAIDAAGNVDSTPASYTWSIDASGPETTISAQPPNPSASTSASFSFSSSKPSSNFECALDAAGFSGCTSPRSYSGLSEGSHTFSVRATDAFGNVDQSPATYTWTVDTAAPDTTITGQPSDPSNNPSPSFSFTSSEPTSTFECSLDGGVYSGCTSPSQFSTLADGSHTFTVRATDAAGNVDQTPAVYSWAIDTSSPETTITAQPSNPSALSTATFSFTSSKPNSTFLCQVDGGLLGNCSSPVTYVGLGDGSHTFTVDATDALGNTDPTPATYTWTINTAAPDTTITSQPPDPSNDSAPTFTFTSTKPNSAFQCQLDTRSLQSCSSPASYGGLADGTHTFSVFAVDAAGNPDPTPATYTWTIDTSGNTNAVDEVHYTFTGPTSVAFDWRGNPTDLRYGPTSAYGTTVQGHEPSPLPFSSPGPFREIQLTGLQPGTTYHYSIGGGADHTFSTAPTGNFRFDVLGDVGSTLLSSKVGTVAGQVAGDNPSFVIVAGDLTYANVQTQASVDQHFNDVMAWSQTAAYMPSWGNHEWETPTADDLRNYKGRFMIPNAQAVPSAPPEGCCGEDWGWFDAGGVRFVSYPELYHNASVGEWQTAADQVFAAAQADPNIHFIVTYGHEPAYSTGLHTPNATLASALDSFGDRYSKYVLNINGHNHDYERFQPIHGVTHITTGAATSMETPWVTTDPRLVYRAFHTEHLRIDVSSDGLRVDAICGPASSAEDTTCSQGDVLDSVTIGAAPPPPPPAPTLYVDNGNPSCTDTGLGTVEQPFCTIGAAASRVNPGQTVQVASGAYAGGITVPTSATATAPIVFTAAPGASVTLTGGANGFAISNKSYITITGFNVTGTTGMGISVQNSSNITISNNHVTNAGQPVSGQTKSGIYLNTDRDSTVSGNTVDHNSSFGIYLVGSTRNLIKGNESFSNAQGFQRAASGIRLYSSTSNTIDSNRLHNNEDSGLESFTNSNDNLIVDNVSYDNGDHGIDNYQSTGQRIFGNSVYHNVTAGINVEGGSTGATVANNISVDNGLASPRTHSDIRVENGSTAGTTLDNDLVYLTTSDILLIWNSVPYNTLAAFTAASGQEVHGIQADPRWVNTAGRDFHLTAGSPAVDSANAGVSGQPSVDFDGHNRVDDPLTPDTGSGPRSYDDRGAYELQAPQLDHISVSPANATIQAGGAQAFTTQGFDPSGTPLGNVTSSTTFAIAPDGSCSGNVCTATKAGPHTVTASDHTTDGTKTASASLLVTPLALHHLVLSPGVSTLASGASQAFTAEGRDVYDNSLGDVTATTTFSISPNGSCLGATCTASIAGPHTVTGTNVGKTGSASLQVIAGVVDHILIAPSSSTIVAGNTRAYTAEGFDTAGNSVGDVTAGTSFSISPDGSCTASVCTATVAGPHTVTGNNGGKTSTGSLTVIAGPLDHLAVSPNSSSITAGGSRTFSAEGRDQYGNSRGDVTSTTTFSIQPDGSCSGASCSATTAGLHTIAATNGSASGAASLQVDPAAPDHLVLSPASSSITVGDSQSYTAAGRDAYGNSTGDVTPSATFTIQPEGSCSGPTCTVAASGQHTVTASAAGVTGTASLQALTVSSLVITPADTTITAGASRSYTVEGFDAEGNSLGDVTSTTHFSITPDGSCTLNVCTATPAWPHTVRAENAGATSSTSLFVNPAALDHLALNTDTSSIAAGGSATFEANGRDRFDNSTGDVTAGTTFTISPNGSCSGATCTATVAGPHTVTGTSGTATGTYALDVTAAVLDHLVLSPASATISAGDSQDFTAEGRDVYGNSTGDVTAFAAFSVAPDGSCLLNSCTASLAGGHTVTADFGGATGTASLDVLGSNVDHIVVSPSASEIAAGGSQPYTVEAFDSGGNPIGDVTSSTTFAIAPNGSCSGNSCTATAAGAHTVTATAAGKTATASLAIDAGALNHLALSPSSATITAGGSQAYTAQGRDQYDNSLGDVTASTTFTIAPNGSCTGASCTASVAGAHTVTGTSSGKTGTASLQVNAGPLDHIAISPASAAITAGSSRSYTAQAFDATGNSLGDVTAATTFTVAPDGSCTLNTCTTTVAGAHSVTGNDAGKTGSASLTVNPGPLDHLALSPSSASITAGGSQAYTAQGRDQFDNSLGDRTASTTFTLAPNGSCSGASCTASVAGAHTVTGTSSGKTGTASLQVNATALDHIVISPSSATIAAGGSQSYTAQAFDAANNSLGDVTSSTTFSVLPNGSCTGATCTATISGAHTVTGSFSGKTSTGSLTVNPAPLDHLALTPSSATITAGGSQSYTAQGRDRYDNSLGDVTASTTFTISPNGSCVSSLCSATVSGAHTVTGTFLGATGTAALQVNTGPLDHIVLSPASTSVPAGTPQTYSAEGFDALNNSLGSVTSATTFSITPDGSCSGATCTTINGGAHTVTGNDGGKTASATLNADFVKNGGFETDLTGWNTSGSGTGITLTRFSGGHSGGWSAQLTNTASTNQSCLLNDSPNWALSPAPGTYTASLWVRGDRAGAPLKLRLREYNSGGTLLGTSQSQITLSTSWQQVSVPYTITASGSTLDLNAFLSSVDAPPGNCFYADDASLLRGVPLDHITISPASATLTAGSTQAYTAQGFDAAGNSLGDVTSATTFSITPNGSCTGAVCTASLPGSHTVTGNDGGKTSTASLSVVAGPLDHLALSPASATITAGGSQSYTATGFDSAGNSLGDMTSTTTFTLAPDGSCTGATCTATTAGAHTVTGTKSGKTGNASLTVNPAALDHLALSPTTSTITAGGAQTYSADGRDQYNNSLGDVTGSTAFTIAPDGSCSGSTCVATTSGPHTVTGTNAGKTGTAALTVNPAALDHLALSPGSGSISAGSSQAYTAQGRDQYDNSLGDMTGSTTFTIGPNGSCSVNVCSATTAGVHTVSGTKSGKTGTASLTVNAAGLDHLVLSPASTTISAGGSQTYSAEGRDQYDNSLGDVTALTTFTVAPNGSCAGTVCGAAAAGAHTVTGTSSGKTGTASLTVGAGGLDHITITPASATIAAGGSQAYTAQGFDSAGNSLGDVTGATTFSIAPDGSCAGATCTATTAGAHSVTGNDGGKTAGATLTVNAGPLDHLALSPASATITAGGSQAYTAQGRDQYDNSLGDVTSATTFTIAPNGSCTGATCTATAAGAHTVTGTKSGKTGTASLSVNAGPLDHLALSPASATITAGGSQAYTAQGRDQYDNSLGDVTSATTFTIAPNGSCSGATCTPSSAGAHTVSGTSSGAIGTASLQVNPSALDHIVISPASATITAGGSRSYSAEGFDALGNSRGDVTSSTTFTISPNGSCTGATCTATVAGAHAVTANDAGKTDTASLTVNAGPFDHLALSPSSATITAGGSQAYTAQGRDQYDNSLGDVTGATTFTIAPNGSCAATLCSATTAGAHTVSGTAAGKTGTATLIVTTGGLDHIVISPSSATIPAAGSKAYTAEGFDAVGNSLGDVTAQTTFSIAPDGSCSASVCTASVPGTHTVTGDDAGKTSTASLQVAVGAVDHLVLSPASATITSGGSRAYTAEGFDSAGNSVGDVTASTTFTIAPDGSCTGSSCTAALAGNHTVTGHDGSATGTAALNVNAGPPDHIVVSPASASIAAGGSQAYTAQSRDAAGNPLGDVTADTTFTIAPNGSCSAASCTATAAGVHTVTGTDGGFMDSASLTVNAGAFDHLTISPASAVINSGGSQAYTAEGFDQYSNSLGDITPSTTFTIAPDGSCTGATCTASVAGAHTVTGARSGKTATASLQVNSGGLDHIVISPSSATITAGGSRSYTAEAFDVGGNSLGDVTAVTSFSIAPNGSCTANSCSATTSGAHTVTGTSSGKTSTATLTVNPAALDHLALSPASATVTAGGSRAYTAQGRDQFDNSLGDVTGATTFTIAPNGSCSGATCTASAAGAHTVTGTSSGATGTASLQVNAGAVDHITLSPSSAFIESGASQSYTAAGFDSFNNPLGDVTAATSFSIAPNGSCTGSTCTAIVGGTHTVTGTDSGKTSTASLSVNFIRNPGFETDLTGWNTSGSGTGVTLTRVSGGHSGGWSAFLTNTNSTNQTCLLNDSPNWIASTVATTYTASLWVRADKAGAPLNLRVREYNAGGTLLNTTSSQVTLSTSWQRVSVTYTVTTPGTNLDLNAYLASANAPSGSCFYADDASVTTP